jgi:hypothetical protein
MTFVEAIPILRTVAGASTPQEGAQMSVAYRIHPAIGIARVGDSPDEYFVGPEAPGVPPSLTNRSDPTAQQGSYKDGQHRIKRQGARFRVYEYTTDPAGVVTKVRELTAAEADIDWEVHLVNRKAAEETRFFPDKDRTLRNEGVDRKKLVIDPGAQRISGPNQAMKKLVAMFMDSITVALGDLLTDSAGRLVVLGGHGKSQSHDGRRLSESDNDFADNDGWCDDTSDGPVSATVKLHGATVVVAADPAWVIVAPPDFAPAIENVVTLYDLVYDMMATLDRSLAVTATTPVSFTTDIYPILRRVSNMHWVSDFAGGGHGPATAGHFVSQLGALASNSPENAGRQRIFHKLQNPRGGGTGDMPKLATAPEIPGVSLTHVQYQRMARWAKGTFDADWTGTAPTLPAFDQVPAKDQPHALDRAALEGCVGGPFFPGIEVGRIMLDKTTYQPGRPFRINTARRPGELTARMAVPWQADFFACESDRQVSMDWWPGQRPDQVLRGLQRARWRLGVSGMNDMVKKWSQLGFVVETATAEGVAYAEDERTL